MKKFAFTLSEVLITLGVIGIVASMTLPTVINTYQKKVTAIKLKKAYNTLTNVVNRAYFDNGNVTYSGAVTKAASKEFFNKYWIPYLNSPEIFPENQYPYGSSTPYMTRNGEVYNIAIYTSYTNGRILLTTADGIIYYINVMDWDKDADGNTIPNSQHFSTAQYVFVDLNGTKPPNTFGKDIFTFNINFNNNVVRPSGYTVSKSVRDSKCQSTGLYCAAKIMAEGWELKGDYPW